MPREQSETIWVVVRRDFVDRPFDPAEPHLAITLREAVPTAEEADSEAARLNAVNEDKGCFYFAAPTRWFPSGRNVDVGY